MSPYLYVIAGTVIFGLLCFYANEALSWQKRAEEMARLNKLALESFETRERELLSELNWYKQDSNRLAGIVAQYITDIDRTAVLMKDDQPPALKEEREALSLHQKLISKL